jgi:hypothetical protein
MDLKELQRLEKAIGPLQYGAERSVANRALADALLVAAPELLARMAKLEAVAEAAKAHLNESRYAPGKPDLCSALVALDALTTAEPR